MATTQEPLRLALLGAGIFMTERHLPALLQLTKNKLVEIKAVYSRTQESAQKLREKFPSPDISVVFGGEDELKKLLDRTDIDAVDIALPILAMPFVVKLALQHNKHVFSEKPIAADFKTGAELLQYHRNERPNLVWVVGENWRFHPSFVTAAKFIKQGKIGRVLCATFEFRASMLPDNKYYNTAWRKDPHYQGGFLLDGGVHFAAALRLCLGEVLKVSAQVTQIRDYLPPADTFSASIQFNNSVTCSATVTFACLYASPPQLVVHGEKGSIRVSRQDLELTEVSADATTVLRPKFDPDFEVAPVREEFIAFINSIKKGAPSVNSPLEALKDVAIVEAILESGKTGQSVSPKEFN